MKIFSDVDMLKCSNSNFSIVLQFGRSVGGKHVQKMYIVLSGLRSSLNLLRLDSIKLAAIVKQTHAANKGPVLCMHFSSIHYILRTNPES